MISKLEYFIAWRYLKTKKKESFISVVSMFSLIGTALGVAALIAVMAVMAGVREEWTNKLIGTVGDINVYSADSPEIDDYKKILTKITQNKLVESATPIIERQVLVSIDQQNIGVQVRGIDQKDLNSKPMVANNIIAGSIKNMVDDGLVVGATLARSLGVTIGDKVKIISPQTNNTFIGSIPRFKTCKIIGVFDSGMPDFDGSVIFMSRQFAEIYFKMPKQINLIEVATSNIDQVDLLREQLDITLEDQYRLIDWKQRNAAFMNALQTEKVAMFMILTLIVLVAAFNIISSLIMLVKDKTADIAILRTMGASKRMIVKIFMLCGVAIGVSGTVLGVILGISFAKNIETIRLFLQNLTNTNIFDPVVYFLSFLPAKIYMNDVITITCMSLAVSFLATIYPAYRAAKLNPANALK
jgi:lipoprotein-releasing system permease protein